MCGVGRVDHDVEVISVNTGVIAFQIFLTRRSINANSLHGVWGNIESTIRDDARKIAHLKRIDQHFTVTNTDGVNG